MVITFNYKDGTDTITFDDLKAALDKENTGSDLDCSTAPERNDNLSKDKTSFLFVFLSSLSNCRLQIKDKREQIRTPMSGG